MRLPRILLTLCVSCFALLLTAAAQTGQCPIRPGGGGLIKDPTVLRSENGVLNVALTIYTDVNVDGSTEYCYVFADGTEAPTLVVNPGDVLYFTLTNGITPAGSTHNHAASNSVPGSPCLGGDMTASSTNVHFHGLNVPPKCHGDEVIRTLVESGQTFQYSIQIPANEPPGLYWYHPHPHSFTTSQIVGGAAGALIVDGIQDIFPELAGLNERVLVVRQKVLGQGDEGTLLSTNFVAGFDKVHAQLQLKPKERQFWRLVNASSITFLQLQMQILGQPQKMKLYGMDGVPLTVPQTTDTIVIPPAGRADFVVQGPPIATGGQFMTTGYDTGPGGDSNPLLLLADIVANPNASVPALSVPEPAKTKSKRVLRFANLAKQPPVKTRKLYFSENDDGSQFFITVDGQQPKVYEPSDPPAITTKQGSVEDWIIENRSTEVHAFHIHQIHFVELEENGKPVSDTMVRDTVVVPYWDGHSSTYPSVKLRMDFRDPEVSGTFLYHCHILDHEDGGMMAKIKVIPQ